MRTIIISIIAVLSLTFAACNQKKDAKAQLPNEQLSLPEGKLQSSFVCYVQDRYIGKEQIPVEVDGKTYYGCCQGCIDKLENQRNTRYATDPQTNNEVDKAAAFIVVKPDGKGGQVLYFESKETYTRYISTS